MMMRTFCKAVLLAAGLHVAVLTAPAYAQSAPQPAPAPTQPVQPVPYGNSGSVPYGQPAPTPVQPAQPSAPAAQGGDVIYLKNGGILRGTLIDAIPGSQARIQLATGEIATVPWSQINRIEHPVPGASTEGPAKPPTPSAPTAPASPPQRGAHVAKVWVHIEGPDDARLQQDTTGDDDWSTVCTAPCDRELPTNKWYRIVGGGIKTSGQFTLHASEGEHETLNVNGASKAAFVIGVIAVPAGLLVAYIGLVVGLIGSAAQTIDSSSKSAHDTSTTGWTMLGLGLASAVVGVILLAVNWKTSVSQDVGSRSGGIDSDAWKKVPIATWKDATPEQRALAPTATIPILSGSF